MRKWSKTVTQEDYDKLSGWFAENVPGAQAVQNVGDAMAEKTTIIVQQAKSGIRESLTDVLSATASIIKKAAPSALAACASKEYSGVQASFASFLQPVHIRSKYILIGDNRHNTIGYALEKNRTLSALSGFTICQNAVVSYTGTQPTQEEIELIKRYLEAGFYIE